MITTRPEIEFKRSYCKINHRLQGACLVAICAGIVMKFPVVWGLALLGSILTLYHPRFARQKRNVK